jgi:hypothetical protein
MNALLKEIRFYPEVCPHCHKMIKVPWEQRTPFTEASPYPSTYACPLHNILLQMLNRFGLQEIAYLFKAVHTLSELCYLIESGPQKWAKGPDIPVSLAQKSHLWLLVNHLRSTYPQCMRAYTGGTPPYREGAPDRAMVICQDTVLAKLGRIFYHTLPWPSESPIEQWPTVQVANLLLKFNLTQAALMVLSLDINGQTLTELLYYFDHATSKLCRPTCDGGLGLNNDSIMKIRSILDEFSRSQGFVHYSAISPGSRQRLAHHTIKLQIVTRQDVGSSGILGQGALKTYYQHIVPDAPTRALRELLGARPDLSPSAKDGLLMSDRKRKKNTLILR